MKRTVLIILIIAASIPVAMIACKTKAGSNVSANTISQDSLISRGAYLVTANVCDDCHSPKTVGPHGFEIIPELRFSGFQQNAKLPSVDTSEVKKGWTLFNEDLTAAVGPWGVSFSANLTSDPTGIGNWSEEQFLKAIREGKLKGVEGTRPILPPMPWQNFRNMTDEDLKAIFAFLKSTKPVRNVVPGPRPLAQVN
jgi:hypothetical protein